MNNSAVTLIGLLEAGGADAVALSAPGGVPLAYGALRALVARTVAALNARGIGRNDRVAIVLDNGPEMAAAFICVAAGATAAPLNPAYRAEEFEFYLRDLGAKVLMAERGRPSPALEVAQKLGVPVVRLAPRPELGAGVFALEFPDSMQPKPARSPGPAAEGDIALVLHTSGTTSRPKSCRSPSATCAPRRATCAGRWRSPPPTAA
jgi:acyl-coenzyme A synthetase/AMP-(fatty) acid ligase